MIFLFSFSCNAKVNELLTELSFVKRHLTLTDEQEFLWKNAISKTGELPTYTSGTRSAFRKSMENILNSPGLDINDLQQKIVVDHFGLVEKAVDHHIRVGVDWAVFDQSLDTKQRLIFRAKLKPILISIYKNMTTRSERGLIKENLLSSNYREKLKYTPEQILKIEDISRKSEVLRTQVQENNALSIVNIADVLDSVDEPFINVVSIMKENFHKQKITTTQLLENSNEIYRSMNETQRKELTVAAKNRIKLVLLFLPKD